MPRRQPPKGYIRLKKAHKVLSINSAIIKLYVQKRKIKYFVPEGKTRGFYLIRSSQPRKRIFSFKIEKSGATVTEQYRRAFNEWKQQNMA